jgi:hypothetical protein
MEKRCESCHRLFVYRPSNKAAKINKRFCGECAKRRMRDSGNHHREYLIDFQNFNEPKKMKRLNRLEKIYDENYNIIHAICLEDNYLLNNPRLTKYHAIEKKLYKEIYKIRRILFIE